MPASTFASRALRFYTGLTPPRVPRGIQVMNPYADSRVREYACAFLRKHFADNEKRVLVFGINPGRFGAGITGITFTDPVALADFCRIPNDLQRRRELSSIFIYDFIERFGGPVAFYRRFFLTAVSPLGFTREGRNLNYYDDRELERRVTPFITRTLEQQIALGARRDRAIVLGIGKNVQFLERLNAEREFFGEILSLKHPRPIMQYNRRQVDRYLAEYEEVFARAFG
jgi:hypothetical protein